MTADKRCEQCGQKVTISEVTGSNEEGQWVVRWKGWICPCCHHVDTAIGREKKIEVSNGQE